MKTIRLGQLLESFDSGRRPIKSSERRDGPTPYLGASGTIDFVSGHTHSGDFLCVAEDGENLRTRNVPIAWVQCGEFWANNHLHVLGGLDRPELRFIEGALMVTDISGFLTGSTQPKLTQSALLAIEIPEIDRSSRVAIGEMLSALHDKIAVNRQVLEISDALVRQSYLALAGLPTVSLGEVADNVKSSVAPSVAEAGTRYVALDDLDRRSLWVQRWKDAGEANSTKSAFRPGDTLFGKLRPYFHKVGLTLDSGICSTDILVIRARRPQDRWIVAAAASSDRAVELAVSMSNGTRMPRASWSNLSTLRMPDPDCCEVRLFSEVTESIAQTAAARTLENSILTRTRDELLPLLMNGRITVKDAEKVAENVL